MILAVTSAVFCGCLEREECQIVSTNAVAVVPSGSCLTATAVNANDAAAGGCQHPTLMVSNRCTDPAVIAGDYTVDGYAVTIAPGASGIEVAILLEAGDPLPSWYEYAVPVRIGNDSATLRFVALRAPDDDRGGYDDDDDDDD